MTPRLPPAIGDGSIATPRIGTRSTTLVANVENKPERDHDCCEGARRQSNVGRLKGEAKLTPKAFGDKSLWDLFTGLVRKPVLVTWDSSLPKATTIPSSGISCGFPNVKSDIPGSNRLSP